MGKTQETDEKRFGDEIATTFWKRREIFFGWREAVSMDWASICLQIGGFVRVSTNPKKIKKTLVAGKKYDNLSLPSALYEQRGGKKEVKKL